MEIRIAKSQAEKYQIYKFRYKIYVEEMNRKQVYADHNSKTIKEPLDNTGHLFAAYDNNLNIIGTMRNNLSKEGNLDFYSKLYGMGDVGEDHPNHTAIVTKFMIDKRYRKKSILFNLIMTESYRSLLKNNIKFCFIDVNYSLVKFFTRYGFKYLSKIIHPEYGEVHLMRLDIIDIEHLYEVRSPLYETLKTNKIKTALV